LQQKLDELGARKAVLEREITNAPAPAPRLHPNLAEIYRRKISNLREALSEPDTQAEALEILRGLIERVSVRSTSAGFEIELVGEIANMVRLSAGAGSQKKRAISEFGKSGCGG